MRNEGYRRPTEGMLNEWNKKQRGMPYKYFIHPNMFRSGRLDTISASLTHTSSGPHLSSSHIVSHQPLPAPLGNNFGSSSIDK